MRFVTFVRRGAAGFGVLVDDETVADLTEALPGVGSLTDCSNSTLTVTADAVNGPDLKPATSVSVTYRGVNLIPIPGLLTGRLSFTRNVKMRVKP